MNTHILVTTNNFSVGGRETYVATYARAAAQAGLSADLLCANLQAGLPELSVFRSAVAVGHGPLALRQWLDAGSQLVAERRPALIWAQHFALLPAWLLTRLHGIPLLTTFHGPLVDVGRPNDVLEALGMTLALRRGELLSGVSPETCADIGALADREAVLLPNTVASERRLRTEVPAAWPPARWLLITRQEKLGHLRATVRLFAAFRARFPGASLAIASGASPTDVDATTHALSRLRRGLDVLGYRWCREQGLTLWRALPAVQWLGYSATPRELAREADLVLGMGRVILEGLAEGRPALLVGYEDLHGVVAESRWDLQARTNFSGRGVPVADLAACLGELTGACPPAPPPATRFREDRPAERLLQLAGAARPTGGEADHRLALRVRDLLQDGVGEPALFAQVAGELTQDERACLFRLSRG